MLALGHGDRHEMSQVLQTRDAPQSTDRAVDTTPPDTPDTTNPTVTGHGSNTDGNDHRNHSRERVDKADNGDVTDHSLPTVPVTIRGPVPSGEGSVDTGLGGWSRTAPINIDKLGLWLVDADKAEARHLIGDLGVGGVGFSPDGKFVAVSATETWAISAWQPSHMYVVNVKSGERHQIASDARATGTPRWSANGQWIGFSVDNEIWIMHADGSGRRRIDGDGGGALVTWSPTRNAFAAALINENQVLIYDLDTGTEQRFPYQHPYLVDWSPSGATLAVSSSNGMARVPTTHRMNPATGALTKIMDNAWFPRWSPTSNDIAVTHGGQAGVVSAAGGAFVALGSGDPIDWSSDGRSIDYQGGTYNAMVANVATGESRTIASVSSNSWSLSPTVWVPRTRLVAVIAQPYAAGYSP